MNSVFRRPLMLARVAASHRHEIALFLYNFRRLREKVGIGMYILIGFAASVVVVMYSWMGWTLYMGIKEGKKRN